MIGRYANEVSQNRCPAARKASRGGVLPTPTPLLLVAIKYQPVYHDTDGACHLLCRRTGALGGTADGNAIGEGAAGRLEAGGKQLLLDAAEILKTVAVGPYGNRRVAGERGYSLPELRVRPQGLVHRFAQSVRRGDQRPLAQLGILSSRAGSHGQFRRDLLPFQRVAEPETAEGAHDLGDLGHREELRDFAAGVELELFEKLIEGDPSDSVSLQLEVGFLAANGGRQGRRQRLDLDRGRAARFNLRFRTFQVNQASLGFGNLAPEIELGPRLRIETFAPLLHLAAQGFRCRGQGHALAVAGLGQDFEFVDLAVQFHEFDAPILRRLSLRRKLVPQGQNLAAGRLRFVYRMVVLGADPGHHDEDDKDSHDIRNDIEKRIVAGSGVVVTHGTMCGELSCGR